jgi:hypothetical protein
VLEEKKDYAAAWRRRRRREVVAFARATYLTRSLLPSFHKAVRGRARTRDSSSTPTSHRSRSQGEAEKAAAGVGLVRRTSGGMPRFSPPGLGFSPSSGTIQHSHSVRFRFAETVPSPRLSTRIRVTSSTWDGCSDHPTPAGLRIISCVMFSSFFLRLSLSGPLGARGQLYPKDHRPFFP